MGLFFLTLLSAGLVVAFGRRLPGPGWLVGIARATAMVVLVVGLGFIALMLAFHALDVKWH